MSAQVAEDGFWNVPVGPRSVGGLACAAWRARTLCMQTTALGEATVHTEKSAARVFASWILRGKLKQILLKMNPSEE